MTLNEIGLLVLKRLTDHGFSAYFVGGMVRDTLLTRAIYDIDVTTNARPDEVIQLFERVYLTGIAHGTVTVVVNEVPVEVTTFRTESKYDDFRRPNEVVFSTSLDEDLKRRDFTVNAIAMDQFGELIDPFNGQHDLNSRCLRAVGNAKDRFIEDPLRMLRAIRFVSKLGFELEQETYKAIFEVAPFLAYISKERVKSELSGILKGENRQQACDILLKTSLLSAIGLSSLQKFKRYNFNHLNDAIELFMIIGSHVEDFKSYVTEWPFSKKERQLIEAYARFVKKPLDLTLVRYYEKDEFMIHFKHITLFLTGMTIELPPLVIHNRKEIKLSVAKLKQFLQKPDGPWISDYFKLIESAIVLGELENDEEKILAYVRRCENEANNPH